MNQCTQFQGLDLDACSKWRPDDTDSLDVLRDRFLGKKGLFAQSEHGLVHRARIYCPIFIAIAENTDSIDQQITENPDLLRSDGTLDERIKVFPKDVVLNHLDAHVSEWVGKSPARWRRAAAAEMRSVVAWKRHSYHGFVALLVAVGTTIAGFYVQRERLRQVSHSVHRRAGIPRVAGAPRVERSDRLTRLLDVLVDSTASSCNNISFVQAL